MIEVKHIIYNAPTDKYYLLLKNDERVEVLKREYLRIGKIIAKRRYFVEIA